MSDPRLSVRWITVTAALVGSDVHWVHRPDLGLVQMSKQAAGNRVGTIILALLSASLSVLITRYHYRAAPSPRMHTQIKNHVARDWE